MEKINQINKLILAGVFFFLSLGVVSAQVVFSGTNGTLDFEAPNGSFMLGGVTVTLAANDGVVNGTTSGLGINDPFTGTDTDDTNALDTINIVEALTFSFDTDVIFNSIFFSEVGVNDAVDVSFNGASLLPVTSSGLASFDEVLLAGEILVLTAAEQNPPNANNGVSITQFTVTPIPEPSSGALICLAGMAVLLYRRRLY